MGMYDEFKIDVNILPLSNKEKEEVKDIRWQTKSFSNLMTEIKVNSDGYLEELHEDWEDVPMEERPFPNPKTPLEELTGSMRKVNPRWIPLKLDIIVNFYGQDKDKTWYEFDALFEEGKLKWIKRVTQ